MHGADKREGNARTNEAANIRIRTVPLAAELCRQLADRALGFRRDHSVHRKDERHEVHLLLLAKVLVLADLCLFLILQDLGRWLQPQASSSAE